MYMFLLSRRRHIPLRSRGRASEPRGCVPVSAYYRPYSPSPPTPGCPDPLPGPGARCANEYWEYIKYIYIYTRAQASAPPPPPLPALALREGPTVASNHNTSCKLIPATRERESRSFSPSLFGIGVLLECDSATKDRLRECHTFRTHFITICT